MLDAWVIGELLKKQREQKQRQQQPGLQLPVGPSPGWEPTEPEPEEDTNERGVLIIQL